MKKSIKKVLCSIVIIILVLWLALAYFVKCHNIISRFMTSELYYLEDMRYSIEELIKEKVVKYEWLSEEYQKHITRDEFEAVKSIPELTNLLNPITPRITLLHKFIYDDRDRYKTPCAGGYMVNGEMYYYKHAIKIGVERFKPVIIEWKILPIK